MRYPNQRYGNPAEFEYYTQGMSNKTIAKLLKRDQKTIFNYRNGVKKIPWWVPELLRLWHKENMDIARQMGYAHLMKTPLRIVSISEGTIDNRRTDVRRSSDPDHTQGIIAPRLKAI